MSQTSFFLLCLRAIHFDAFLGSFPEFLVRTDTIVGTVARVLGMTHNIVTTGMRNGGMRERNLQLANFGRSLLRTFNYA
jgi:hypothetical protein